MKQDSELGKHLITAVFTQIWERWGVSGPGELAMTAVLKSIRSREFISKGTSWVSMATYTFQWHIHKANRAFFTGVHAHAHTQAHTHSSFRKLKWWPLEHFFPILEIRLWLLIPWEPPRVLVWERHCPHRAQLPLAQEVTGWMGWWLSQDSWWGGGRQKPAHTTKIKTRNKCVQCFNCKDPFDSSSLLCFERWYKVAWMKESSAFFKLYVYWCLPECDMHGHSKWCFLWDSWTDIFFGTILYLF